MFKWEPSNLFVGFIQIVTDAASVINLAVSNPTWGVIKINQVHISS